MRSCLRNVCACPVRAGSGTAWDGKSGAVSEWLRKMLQLSRVWPLEEDLADAYGVLFRELRQAGRSLSQVDIMLAAMARSSGLILLTHDRDFEAVQKLKTESWL